MKTLNEVLRDGAATLQESGYVHGQREAEVILGHLTDLDTAKLFTQGEDEIDESVTTRFHQAIKERIQGKPLAYIVGSQQFMGWLLKCDERALIPRPETEQLVENLVKIIRERKLQSGKVLEIGTGSGAIAITLKKYFPTLEVVATDVSTDALELAEDNAQKLGVDIEFRQSDLFKELKPDRFDIVVANLPYVPSERLDFVSEEILDWEPMVAIEAGEDGYSYIRRFFENVSNFLNPESLIAIEMWHTHGPLVHDSVEENLPGSNIEIRQDLAGFDRFAFVDVSLADPE